MASTTPDGIRSPGPGDPFQISTDLAILANDVQTALTRRANAYTGTTAERNAFSAPDGVLWTDTDGTRLTYTRKNGQWAPLMPDTDWVALTPAPGFTAVDSPAVRKIGDRVSFKGAFKYSTNIPTSSSTGVPMFTLPGVQYRPAEYLRAWGASYASGTANGTVAVFQKDSNTVSAFGVGASMDILYLGSITYLAGG